jgi:hypothetical protein
VRIFRFKLTVFGYRLINNMYDSRVFK